MTPALRAGLVIACGWVAAFIAVMLFRPLMPVDETRYMSVAWEMLIQNHWILPTLNFEPYSHKPPLLFWLIRISWGIFGIDVLGPRVFLFSIAGLVFYLTFRLARMLFPQNDILPTRAVLFLTALPLVLAYASTIMFDTFLSVFVVSAMIATWRAAQGYKHSWIFLGTMLGLGILTKGPVAIVYMLPVALLAPVWTKANWKRWYAGVALAFVIGAGIGLVWAIPAALQGGHDYTHKIFVTQAANRMVNAFDHEEPFWFYAPILALFLLPLLTCPALWRRPPVKDTPFRFLACWTLPVVVFFCAISSKSVHYMMPVMPGFAIMAAMMVQDAKLRWSALPVALLVLPSIVTLAMPDMILAKIGADYPWLAVLHIVLSAGLIYGIYKKPVIGVHAMAAAAFMVFVVVHAQLGDAYLKRYDLQRLAVAMAPYKDRWLVASPKYDGEYGYILRMTRPIPPVGREDVPLWLDGQPTTIIIGRYKPNSWPQEYHVPGKAPARYRILDEIPFRNNEVLTILEKR